METQAKCLDWISAQDQARSRLGILFVMLLATVLAPSLGAQGTVAFANNNATLITNCVTELPQDKTIYVQLYFTMDLSAATNDTALASMITAGSPLKLAVAGRFSQALVSLPGVPIGASVVLQVRAWATNYPGYEQARANGGETATSLPWMQVTGGGISPPTILWQWGFRPFRFPDCGMQQVPLFVSPSNAGKLMLQWPLGVPPAVQMRDAVGAEWETLNPGAFVQDHWEFEIQPTNTLRLFRLAR